ncbi:segregation/condensation protein A [Halogeometricum sp. S1BR25-6]|uniref:Segregation/condensation protein A n=1 Tax=Halogeometricum salsisoli TaxID=2950536 RepID=A0ABU2GB42_9EURY|nr:segregation/condensation protein A [Halogeometricum sp. S1BR25-6]MDS0298031.1 segregation/condensation protein A [Halogeometricum sp. S1BR25-6]
MTEETDADAEPPESTAESAVPDGVDLDLETDTDADDGEVEPVELLVQLAEEGEIDPWDIDVVDVTDAFLARLDATDLRTSGRALFYASVLLRMKSDALLEPDAEEEEPELEPWEMALENGGEMANGEADGAPGSDSGFDPVDALEAEMDRRLERKQARGSPETLDELVRELREAERESWWKRRREYDTSDSPRGYSRGTQTLDYRSADDVRADDEPTAADVTGTAHTEDIESSIAAVETALSEQYEKGREEVLYAEIRTAAETPVTTYLSLLFLSHRGTVRLQQDDLFGDLWVRDPASVEDESDADSDADAESEDETAEAEAIAD